MKKLEPLPEEADDDLRYGGWGGLQIRSLDTPEMGELWLYFRQMRAHAGRDQLPVLATGLLEEMRGDPGLFERRISPEGGEDSTLARIPVLTAMPVQEFVDTLLALHPMHQRRVFAGMRSRYEHGAIDGRLLGEREWFDRFETELRSRMESQRGLTRDRLTRQLGSVLQVVRPEVESAKPE